jgi:acyl-CoA synthetase (AMP-forming)/AMP-acid ligase II
MSERIGESLRWYATYTPERPAIIDGGTTFTFAQLWERACRLADALAGLGIGPGDRVAALLANGHRYLEIYEAAALMDVAVVPLNFRFVASEVDYVVNHAEASALVFDTAFADLVEEARPGLTSIGSNYIAADGPAEGAHRYEDLLAAASDAPPARKADPDATFFQGYTSGTTGFPKGCVNPHGPFADQLRRMATLYGIGSADRILAAAPLFHEAPVLFSLTQLIAGGTVVVTADATPEHLLEMIARHRITWAFKVPTMWANIAASAALKTADVSSMRVLLSAGSPLLTRTKETLLEYFPEGSLNEFYGGTEVGLATNLWPEDQRRKTRSVGTPVYGMYIELRDDDGNPVPQGEVGEIHIGGGTLLREYFKNPEASAEAIKGDWITLGDMGRFDEEGYLYIVDRKKDMIISGGENIFPADIEEALYRHPAVEMCAVVGAPDERWGEIVVAAVLLKPEMTASEDELVAHCREHLSRFKVPRRIDFLDEMPLSAFGKILRREVRRTYWEGEDVKI